MSQVTTKRTPIKKVLARTEFVQGYKDAMTGVGFYEKYEQMTSSEQWTYERGRQFFFAAGPMRIRQGRGVTREAIQMYRDLRNENVVL